MNKVLVTGLALGRQIGLCEACNFDFEWLIRYPSVFLWADRILVADTIWDTVSRGGYPYEAKELARSLQLVFQLARSEGIIEVFKPAEIISSDLKDLIVAEVHRDRELLLRFFPEHVTLGDEEHVPGEIFVDGLEYCAPHLYTIYASFVLSRALNAHCLFNMRVLNYCKYKFGLASFPKEGEPGGIEAFQSVFEAYVPNSSLFPEYVYINREMCAKCANEDGCRDTYLAKVESNLREMLSWRSYDEIQQLKSVVSDIVRRRREFGGIINPSEILHDFRDRQSTIRKRVKLIFPRVRRWANITTMLSIPMAVTGLIAGTPSITVSGAALAGLSHGVKELVDWLSSKHSWIGFISKEVELHREKPGNIIS